MACRAYWSQVFYWINLVLCVHIGKLAEVMHVDESLCCLAVFLGKAESTDRAAASVVQDTFLACRAVAFVCIDGNSLDGTLKEWNRYFDFFWYYRIFGFYPTKLLQCPSNCRGA